MTATDDFERLKFISETNRHLHDERRRYEIRILLAVLTLLVLSVAGVLSGKANLSANPWVTVPLVWLAFLVLVAIASGYLWFTHRSNHRNMRIAEAAERQIVKLCSASVVADLEDAIKRRGRQRNVETDSGGLQEGGTDPNQSGSGGRPPCWLQAWVARVWGTVNWSWKGQTLALFWVALMSALFITMTIVSSAPHDGIESGENEISVRWSWPGQSPQ